MNARKRKACCPLKYILATWWLVLVALGSLPAGSAASDAAEGSGLLSAEPEVKPPHEGDGETIDFSRSGYRSSEEPIPFVAVKETLDPLPETGGPEATMAYPQGADSRDRIQAALDRVAALKPGEDGFRGAVFLSKGTYYIGGGLHVKSGVVLRGEGMRDFGTNLIFQNPEGVGITVGGGVAGETATKGPYSMTGVEGLRITSNYNTAAASGKPSGEETAPGEEAGNLNTGILVLGAENVWVRGCQILHAAEDAVMVEASRFVTVRDILSTDPVPENRDGGAASFRSKDSSQILFYHCAAGEERRDFFVAETGTKSSTSPVESAGLFELQLAGRIGERPAVLVLAETLSKASLPMKVVFPRPVVNGVVQGESTAEQQAFEAADERNWKVIMSDEGTDDWTKQWFLDGEEGTIVTNTREGMELNAADGHMVLWTKGSFEGDLKIEYTFTRKDIDGGGVCIIYIQATGRGDEGYETDITEWNDYRKNVPHCWEFQETRRSDFQCPGGWSFLSGCRD